ncbi:unnamed protein product [Auanema sp. JU1783]|nr:unnamed protein product [Auanema sp. JU1783]
MSKRLFPFLLINYLCFAEAIKQNFYSVSHPCVDRCIQWTSEQKSDSSAVSIYCNTLIPCLKTCTEQLDLLAPIDSEYASFNEPICAKIKELTYLEECLKKLDVSHCAHECNTTEDDFSIHLEWRSRINFEPKLCTLRCLHPSYENYCGRGTTMKILDFYELVLDTQKKRFNLSDVHYSEFARIKNELPISVRNANIIGEMKNAAFALFSLPCITCLLSFFRM